MFTSGSVTDGAGSHAATAELSGMLVTPVSTFEPPSVSHLCCPSNSQITVQTLSGQHGKMILDGTDNKAIRFDSSPNKFNTSFRVIISCVITGDSHSVSHQHLWTTMGDVRNQGNAFPGTLSWERTAITSGSGSCPLVLSSPFVFDDGSSVLTFSGIDKNGNAVSGSLTGGFPSII